MDWTKKKCGPCEGGAPRMERAQAEALLATLAGWTLEGDRIRRHFRFRDFKGAMRFVNLVADLAEEEGHHPDLLVHGWNLVDVTLSTHSIAGPPASGLCLAGRRGR